MIADEAWIDTVRLAREIGDVSGLLPTGIRTLRDIPHALLAAIKAALIFLSFEELPSEDMPPRWLWTDSDGLSAHFDEVRRRQRERYGGGGGESEPAKTNDAMRMLIAS